MKYACKYQCSAAEFSWKTKQVPPTQQKSFSMLVTDDNIFYIWKTSSNSKFIKKNYYFLSYCEESICYSESTHTSLPGMLCQLMLSSIYMLSWLIHIFKDFAFWRIFSINLKGKMKDTRLTTITLLFMETLWYLYHFYLESVYIVLSHSRDSLLHLINNL